MKLNLEQIKDITLGAARVTFEDGYYRFYRFTEKQQEVYKNHPDFLKKSFSTSGIRLNFKTDSKKLSMNVDISDGSSRKYFTHDIYCDGKLIGQLGNLDDDTYPLGEFSGEYSLGEGTKEVCIYFPWSTVSKLKELTLDDGAALEPVKKDVKMLIFGDSITHGYDAESPSLSYAARLTDALSAESINKAIGGEVFNPELSAEKEAFEPDIITVAYGTNDWAKCTKEDFLKNCKGFYKNLSENYPKAKIFAITPIIRLDKDQEKPVGKFEDVGNAIKSLVEEFSNVTVISGYNFVPADENMFWDRRLHPNSEGFAHYTENLINALNLKEYLS